jgi:alpha-ketoglutarate-dependent taurine dioxygenase
MKISRIPNFGNFGVYIDDIDMDHMTDEEWMEIGRIFVNELVVVLRNINMSKTQYLDWVPKWGPLKANIRARFHSKYGSGLDATDPSTWGLADEKDRVWLASRCHQLEESGDGRYLTRIYGRHDSQGNMLGYFSHGEVYWHSNEGSSLTFSPAVSLLGWEHMSGSATGFVQTVDLYESMSESFRKELDEMVLVHQYTPGKINENENTNETLALHMRMAFCPVDGSETPLVCTAPNGRRGLHYTVNSRAKIKDMTDADTQKLFDHLDKLVFDKSNIYDHYYIDGRKDLMLFDNSVTLHRRLGGREDRKAFRMQFDISPLIDTPWLPWQHMPVYDQLYRKETIQMADLIGGDLANRMKLPEFVQE